MKYLGILLKIAATVALFWFVFSKVGFEEFAAKLKPGEIIAALCAGVAMLSLQAVIGAMRLRSSVRLVGRSIHMRGSWVACQFGGFFSHTPISFVGGDAMRVWHLTRLGVPLADSAKAVVLDRALGFLGMMTLVILSTPALYGAIRDPRMWLGFLLLLALGTVASVVFIILGCVRSIPQARGRVLRWIAEIATVARYLVAHPVGALKAFILGLAVTFLNVVALWAIGLGYSTDIGFPTTFAAAPVSFLIAMIPISVAGWGLREGAIVIAFGLFGVPASAALTVSITFGIAVLLAYSPAAVLFVLARRASAKAPGAECAPASAPPPGRS